MLRLFGVQEQTERVYRAMLEAPHADLDTLVATLGLSRAEIAAELDRLAEFMLVEPDGSGAAAFLAVAPDQAIEALLARQEEHLAKLQSQVARSRSHVTNYVQSFVDSRVRHDELGFLEVIDEPAVVRSRLYQMVRAARFSACTIHQGDALPAEALAPSSRLDQELLDRKVSVRFLVSASSLAVPHWREHLAVQSEAGVQIRVHTNPGLQAILVDDEIAVIPRAGGSGALILHGPDICAPLVQLFAEQWTNGQPLGLDAPLEPKDQFSEARLRQVVALRAQGHKDETIARKLSTSVRTVRRLVAAAIAELQAESRFQAGVEAVRRDWVS